MKLNIKKSALSLATKVLSGMLFGVGIVIGIYGAYSFQTSTVTPTSTGTGTADTNNSSKNFPLLTRTSTGSYDRNLMSLEAISRMLQSMGALVDDPFPGSLVATASITKTNIVRHAASGTKIWSRCYRTSVDGDSFAAIRTKCAGKGSLLYLSLMTNGNVLEGYVPWSLAAAPTNTQSAAGTYVAYSAPTGANNYYVPNSTYSFYDGVNYKCFGYVSTTYAWCLSTTNEAGTVKSQYMYTPGNMTYYSPATLAWDVGLSAAAYITISEVEVWY